MDIINIRDWRQKASVRLPEREEMNLPQERRIRKTLERINRLMAEIKRGAEKTPERYWERPSF